ncbi:MAG: CDGSH iron-sulfur domain-containing protein [Myxococcales bacterium]|nr:CDGSH iron-sulfur domain-containing protein [Myxococcales bacterium]MDH5307958.1 CDGSH iron-sulfur domain-containing protein [Myxococcales bacterium]MDH5566899.1 CDGSH iron-sulfur domain-containing protein [Myxococcales bacterium]
MSKARYEGVDIEITFDSQRCIHARECVTALPRVFVANASGDWIHPDEATPEQIAALAQSCPSGAIRYRRKDGGADEAPPAVNRVKIRENGPLAFYAELRLDGKPAGCRVTLCRCGASKSKPYCDGSHADAGFVATGEPKSKKLVSLEVRGGPLEIQALEDGPLLVSGPLEIMSGTGRAIERTAKAALCRCGASKNKPYCDGAHAKVGFRSV